ncbi:MAG: hypothetical protein ABW321_00350 [Polyangiales bacterium]
MDIQGIASRPSATSGGSVTTTTPNLIGAPQNRAFNVDAMSGSVDAPATTQSISGEGLFMRLMQVYETRHPAEARGFLQGIADRLHSDADAPAGLDPNLQAWGDRFQRAADTGDLSNLLPSSQPPPTHFGALAYQRASQPPADAVPPEVEAAISDSLPPTLLEEGLDPTMSGLDADLAAANQASAELTELSNRVAPSLVAELGLARPTDLNAAALNALNPSAVDLASAALNGVNPAVYDPNVVAPTELNAALGGLDLDAVDASIAAANQESAVLYDLAGSALPTLASALDLNAVSPEAAAESGTTASAANLAVNQANQRAALLSTAFPTPTTLGQPLTTTPTLAQPTADSASAPAAPSSQSALSWTSPDLNTR